METIRKGEQDDGTTIELSLKERLKILEEKQNLDNAKKETTEVKKEWKWPFKWKGVMNKSTKPKIAENKVLLIYFNQKNEIEEPVMVPLYGNIVIHKNKAYEFDPRAIWTINLKGKIIKVLALKEIDRRPISNLDIDEVKARGDATDSDEILLKMVTRAVIEKQKKQMSSSAMWIMGGLVVAGLIVYFVFAK